MDALKSFTLPAEIDILPLFGTVVFPQTVVPLAVGQPAALRLLGAAGGPALVGLVALRSELRRPEPVRPEDCYTVGTAALAHRLLRLPDATLRVAVEGMERFAIVAFTATGPTLRAHVRPLPASAETTANLDLAGRVRAQAMTLAGLIPGFNRELREQIAAESDPARLAALAAAASLARRTVAERQRLLELADPGAMLAELEPLLAEEIAIFQHSGASEEEQEADEELPAPAYPTPAARPTRPGAALWLRWGAAGAEWAPVEALQLPGARTLLVTGARGAALRDAAQLALAQVRAAAANLGLAPHFFDTIDLHLHVPPGRARGEDASAGLALAAALAGAITGRALPAGVALAGEITLHGRVLPIDRAREKLLAARRAGIGRLILPAANAEDLAGLTLGDGITLVHTVAEALHALQ